MFVVGKTNSPDRIPAHKYIMASASEKISKMMRSANDIEVAIEDVDPRYFGRWSSIATPRPATF